MRRLIGLSGHARAGKDSVADILNEFSFYRCAIADPMKLFCADVFDWSREYLWGPLKDQLDPVTGICPRDALQRLGTEWGRSLNEDTWVNYTLRTIPTDVNVAITDIRYPNEARRIREAGGEIWRVVRPERSRLSAEHSAHLSERSLSDTDTYEQVIDNSGTLEELHEKVRRCLSS